MYIIPTYILFNIVKINVTASTENNAGLYVGNQPAASLSDS